MSRTVILQRTLWVCVSLGLIFYVSLTLWLALSAIFFPYQLDYGEGIVLWFTRELALGHSIYKGLEGLPYASSNYPPLGMALAVPFRAWFGDSYVGGRWLNLASALIATSFIYRIVRVEGTRWAAALSALLFLGSTFVFHWVPLFRVDLIGLGFTAAGIFFAWRWQLRFDKSSAASHGHQFVSQPRPEGWALVIAGLFFLAAICTKHSLVFAPAAAVVAILLRKRRTAIVFALTLGLAVGGLFVVLDAFTQGGLAFGLITSNATQWLWSTFLATTNDFLWTYLVMIAFALWGWVARLRAKTVGVLEIYAIGAVASLVLAGRVGAWENYFFEAVFVVCVFFGVALARLGSRAAQPARLPNAPRNPRRGRGLGAEIGRSSPVSGVQEGLQGLLASPWWLPILLLIQLGLFWREHDPAIARNLMDITRAGNLEVAPLIRAQQGTVISEDMGLLVTNGKPVDYYTFQYSSLARSGQWDQHWEVENLRSGTLPLVILYQGTREDVDHYRDFTREFVSALDYGYGLSLESERYHAYKPSPLAHPRAEDFDGKLGLVGWSLSQDEFLRAGESVTLTVVWRADIQLNTRYTAFAHLEAAGGGVVAQDDHEPRVGIYPATQAYPTTRWAANEMMRDSFSLRIPTSLDPGAYSLRVGWYDSVTQDRLPVTGGTDFVELTKLYVKP